MARPGDHPDTLLHAADAAMYRAKQRRPGSIEVVADRMAPRAGVESQRPEVRAEVEAQRPETRDTEAQVSH